MEDTALKIVRKKLRERMNELSDAMTNGSCADFGEYRNLCGVIHGLAFAEREILDLQHTMEQDNE